MKRGGPQREKRGSVRGREGEKEGEEMERWRDGEVGRGGGGIQGSEE